MLLPLDNPLMAFRAPAYRSCLPDMPYPKAREAVDLEIVICPPVEEASLGWADASVRGGITISQGVRLSQGPRGREEVGFCDFTKTSKETPREAQNQLLAAMTSRG